MRRHWLLGLVLSLACAPAIAPRLPGEPPPARPALTAGAASNSALAHYQLGLDLLDIDPGRAADALYWACRLDPSRRRARRLGRLTDRRVC